MSNDQERKAPTPPIGVTYHDDSNPDLWGADDWMRRMIAALDPARDHEVTLAVKRLD